MVSSEFLHILGQVVHELPEYKKEVAKEFKEEYVFFKEKHKDNSVEDNLKEFLMFVWDCFDSDTTKAVLEFEKTDSNVELESGKYAELNLDETEMEILHSKNVECS